MIIVIVIVIMVAILVPILIISNSDNHSNSNGDNDNNANHGTFGSVAHGARSVLILPAAVRGDMVLHLAFRARHIRTNGIGGEVRHGVTSSVSCETSPAPRRLSLRTCHIISYHIISYKFIYSDDIIIKYSIS